MMFVTRALEIHVSEGEALLDWVLCKWLAKKGLPSEKRLRANQLSLGACGWGGFVSDEVAGLTCLG